MSKVALNIRDLSPLEKVARAKQIIDALTGNADFPTPQPTLASITAAHVALDTAFTDAQTAKQNAVSTTSFMHEKETELDGLLRQLAGYVESIAGDDEKKIRSAGMSPRSPAAPVGDPTPPAALAATEGSHDGEINLTWNKVDVAKSYEIERSPDPPTASSWTHLGVSTKTSFSATGLTSGTRYWFRVRAVSSSGQSGWSDPATKIAP